MCSPVMPPPLPACCFLAEQVPCCALAWWDPVSPQPLPVGEGVVTGLGTSSRGHRAAGTGTELQGQQCTETLLRHPQDTGLGRLLLLLSSCPRNGAE